MSVVRTPLNAVVNFLELAMDASNSADGVINDNLQKTHDATRSLVHVINDLLVRCVAHLVECSPEV